MGKSFKKMQRKGNKYSRMMKYHPTKSEKKLKEWLQNSNIKFKFQPYFHTDKVLYIPDFMIWGSKYGERIVLEVDGDNHKNKVKYDNKRTEWLLNNRCSKVVRFSNKEVLEDITKVGNTILSYQPQQLLYIPYYDSITKEYLERYRV